MQSDGNYYKTLQGGGVKYEDVRQQVHEEIRREMVGRESERQKQAVLDASDFESVRVNLEVKPQRPPRFKRPNKHLRRPVALAELKRDMAALEFAQRA